MMNDPLYGDDERPARTTTSPGPLGRAIVAVAAWTFVAGVAMAQPPGDGGGAQRATEPDISLTVTVTARELTFDEVGNGSVSFPGTYRGDSVWTVERTRLPRPVAPGVTYRDIGVRLVIESSFADIERIVAEALGEVPVTDDAPPADGVSPDARREGEKR